MNSICEVHMEEPAPYNDVLEICSVFELVTRPTKAQFDFCGSRFLRDDCIYTDCPPDKGGADRGVVAGTKSGGEGTLVGGRGD